MPKETLRYGDSGYWNAQKRWRTADGGKLMAYTVLGNVQLLYYRADVLKAGRHRAAEDLERGDDGVHEASATAGKHTASWCAARRATDPLRLDERHARPRAARS